MTAPRELFAHAIGASLALEPSDPAEENGLPAPVRATDVVPSPAVQWRFVDFMTAAAFGILAGLDGAMKTTMMLVVAAACAGGYRLFGRFQAMQGAVLFVSNEDSDGVLLNRLEAICRGHGWDRERVLANVYFLALSECRLTSIAWCDHLLRYITELNAALVVFDPWAEFGTGDENSNSEARALVQTLRSFSKPTGANVFVNMHFGKPFEGKSAVDRIRGASAIARASRITYTVEHDTAAKELRVTNEKLSRAAKLPPFVVRYVIESEPLNRAVWTLARFDYVSVKEAVLDKAEAFVLDTLGLGDRLSTTDLKNAAIGSGVSGADISRALKSLEMRRKTDFFEGAKNSKLWGLVCLPTDSGQPEQQELLVARQPESLPGNQPAVAFCLPSPFRGKQQSTATAGIGALESGSVLTEPSNE